MKNLSALLKTPAGMAIAVGVVILVGELLIMLLFESMHDAFLTDMASEMIAFEFADPILLVILVSPVLLLLIFRPMRAQQAELERQLDELRSFQRLGIGRELRMKELAEENTALRNSLSAGPAGDITVTSSSPDAPLDAAEQHATIQPTEQGQRSALLFMLKDLEATRKQVEQAHQEWIAALDVVDDPIFLHDKELRILRCNKAYQQRAGMPFEQIIGQPYYEIFPKAATPLPCCLRAMEKAEEEEEEEEEVTVGDASYRSRSFSVRDEQDVHLYSVHILEDITESKRTEAAFRALVGTAAVTIGAAFFHETVRSLGAWLGVECVIVGEIVDGNRVQALAMQLDGKAIERYEYALPGTPCNSIAHKGYCEYLEGVCQLFPTDKDLIDMGAEAYVGMPVRDSNGKVNGILCAISRHKLALPPMTQGVFEIIAARVGTEIERKRAEEKLRETRDYLENLFNHANAPIIVWNPSYQITMFNHAFEHLTGRDANEVIGKQIDTLFPADRKDEVLPHIYQTQTGERWETVEIPILHSSGDVKTALWNSATLYSADGKNVVATMAQGQDITERKQAEAARLESEARFRGIAEVAPEAILLMDNEGKIAYWSHGAVKIFGYAAAEAIGQELHQFIAPQIYHAAYKKGFQQFRLTGQGPAVGNTLEFTALRKDGSEFPVAVSVAALWLRDKWHAVGILRDITERKQAETALQHANRALATLSAVNRELVHASDQSELLQAICQAIVEQRGYKLAWVGYVQHDEGKSIKIMAHAGPEGYLDAMQLTWAETERGMGPSGRAVRSGATQVCQDIANDPQYLPWREQALERGLASNIALPLGDNAVFGILHVYAGEANAFTQNEISLLEEMARDLAFGVRSLLTRQERDQALLRNLEQVAQLRDNLEDTVRAIATIVEMRDPYTAGHQARVADLAAAIAKQMRLPDEQLHAIHLAGTVHDLGKIQVPAEILSKPGHLSEIEYSLIKIHPQAGYDILKGINFPWPIAQMVLQHHERLDGSGYPQGLKGDSILLEARILAVADVVEAMSSHRPYRAGLGIEVALEEITKNRGKFYDPQAVDACVRLFGEKRFAFGDGH